MPYHPADYVLTLVLAMGLGNLPEVRVRQEKWFGLVPDPSNNLTSCFLVVQKQTNTRQPLGFTEFCLALWVQGPVLHFGLFNIWFYSDILLLIVKYSWQYIIVLLGCTGRLYNQTMERHALYPSLEMSVNGVSAIFGLESCVIWVAIGCR